jgi:hypothetical protein
MKGCSTNFDRYSYPDLIPNSVGADGTIIHTLLSKLRTARARNYSLFSAHYSLSIMHPHHAVFLHGAGFFFLHNAIAEVFHPILLDCKMITT